MPLTDTPTADADFLVVGGGVSGLTAAFRLADGGASVHIVEREERPGGTARTTREDGWCCDWGPNGFLTNVTDTVDLAADLGIDNELVPASELAKRRYLWRDGRLVALPMSPPAFATTPLIGLGAKMRVLGEPFATPRDPDVDETVYEFAQRRIGTEFAEAFIRPMVVGITAGDAREVSLDAMFPRMRAMEVEHGSLFRALRAKQKEAAARGTKSDGPAGPGGRLTTFREGGIERLSDALRDRLGDALTTGFDAETLRREDDVWVVSDGEREVRGRKLVLAVPSYVAAELVRPHHAGLSDRLGELTYASVRVLGLGFKLSDIPRELDGFGFLVPPGQPLRMLGCLWTSSIFPSQAPEGHALLRIIAGGVFDPDFVDLTDDEALAEIREELSRTLGIEAEPVFVVHKCWRRGIPQYLRGHLARVDAIEADADEIGVHFTGNAYRGVSLNDCVKRATELAGRLLARD
jgi:protoporphyrinogen/coproporphyrinogen III oxidase